MLITGGIIERNLFGVGAFKIAIYFDALSATLLVMVSFLAIIVTRYARNYLEGDANHGRFLKWLCITIGTVATILVSGNLVMFALAWVATSLSLHQLLTFYSERPSALNRCAQEIYYFALGRSMLNRRDFPVVFGFRQLGFQRLVRSAPRRCAQPEPRRAPPWMPSRFY